MGSVLAALVLALTVSPLLFLSECGGSENFPEAGKTLPMAQGKGTVMQEMQGKGTVMQEIPWLWIEEGEFPEFEETPPDTNPDSIIYVPAPVLFGGAVAGWVWARRLRSRTRKNTCNTADLS